MQASFDQIAKLKAADPAVDLTKRNVTTCNNPTFIAGQPTRNHLAEIAPQPAACDKVGAGPCNGNVGTTNGNPTGNGHLPVTPTTPGSTAGPSVAPTAAPSVNPDPGQVVTGGDGTTTATDLIGVPTELAADSHDTTGVLGVLAVIELLLILVLPPLLARKFFLRKGSSS